MNQTEKIRLLAAFALAEDEKERQKLRPKLEKLLAEDDAAKAETEEDLARDLLLEMGASCVQMGFEYLVTAIAMTVREPMVLRKITRCLYPAIAAEHGTTASKAERACRHEIETIWSRCDEKTLYRHFKNSVDPNKGQPTLGEFISRCAQIVGQRMRQK